MPMRSDPDPAERYSNGLAHAMKRAHVDPNWLAHRVKVDLGQLEAWVDGRELIPPAMARTLAAHLHATVADIMFGLSYDPREHPRISDDDNGMR